MKELEIIGRAEIVSLPEYKHSGIHAKIDTGAYTSCIHCSHIKDIGNNQVQFVILDDSADHFTGEVHTSEIIKDVKVKSSNGQVEHRYLIKTTIELLGKEYPIFLTLTERMDMRYPILIGRRFLRNKFIVDVHIKNQKK